jgi:hypothetical protein
MFFGCTRAAFRKKKTKKKLVQKHKRGPQKEPENRESVKERCIPVANKFAPKINK